MENISNTIEKYVNKTIAKKDGYYMIGRLKDRLLYCCNGKAEQILTLYITMDFGSGMSEYVSYDMYSSNTSVPAIKITGRDNTKLICAHSNSECQLIGFDKEEIAEAKDASVVHQANNIFIYFRTKFYHTWIFADCEHNCIRVIEDIAEADETGNARPDAVTSGMASFFAHKPDPAEQVGDQHGNVPEVTDEVTNNV